MGVVRVATTPVDSGITDMVCTFFDSATNTALDVQPCLEMDICKGVYEARTTALAADLWGHITCPSLPRVNSINRVYPNIASVAVDVAFVRAIEGGRWKIVGQQMLFYAEDNASIVARFDFKNKEGELCQAEDAHERVRL